jgi:hypothetical protein
MTATEALSPAAPARALRRHFALPEEDAEAFDSLGLPWETVRCADNGQQADWLLVLDVPVPLGLGARESPANPLPTATIAIRVTGYPGANLDMVYVNPPLARISQTPIGGLGDVPLDGRTFQQWSRHYQYDPATHCLIGHYRTAMTWLEKEASK